MNTGIATLFLAVITCSVGQHHNNVTQVPVVCPTGWLMVGPVCYKVKDKTKLSWNAALQYCRTQGARLAEPPTTSAYHRLKNSIVMKGCGNGFWIGMFRGKDETVHFQSSNETVMYNAKRPFTTDRDNENCEAMKCWGLVGQKCSIQLAFICEKQAEDRTMSTTTTSSSATTTTTAAATTITTTNIVKTTTKPKDVFSKQSRDEADVVVTTAKIAPHLHKAESGANRVPAGVLVLLPVVTVFL